LRHLSVVGWLAEISAGLCFPAALVRSRVRKIKEKGGKVKPIIDVHAHVFNARDIPTQGYLSSRKSKGIMEGLLSRLLVPRIARCLRHPQDSPLACWIVTEIVCAMMGPPYRGWAKTLSKPVVDITSEMLETYPGISLFVPLMIDFEYWFDDSPDTDIRDQIDRVFRCVVLASQGRIHPFVPFDPARQIAWEKGLTSPGGGPEPHNSLEMVKDAVENKGFIGVKLYNALGYRPLNNASVDQERTKIPLHREMCYTRAMTGQDFDRVLTELYDYCADNGVPITAHCLMDGIESYPKASFDFARAGFWRDVLDDARYKDSLHVNLAHFGWHQSEGYGGDKGWTKEICRMMSDYPHLYTDVSHHRCLSPRNRRQFKNDYVQMREDFGGSWSQIKEKILFGIDWHVIKRVSGFPNFQQRYVEVLSHDGLYTPSDIDDFLGGNAMRFLGLLSGNPNWQRLKDFYAAEGVPHPDWFPPSASPQSPGP